MGSGTTPVVTSSFGGLSAVGCVASPTLVYISCSACSMTAQLCHGGAGIEGV